MIHHQINLVLSGKFRPKLGPLKDCPCANVDVGKVLVCPNRGTSVCSVCKLVSYCSKDCQRAHWKQHKAACTGTLGAESWRPIWEIENRKPTFICDGPNDSGTPDSPLSKGMSLWGNTPAIDLINMKANEPDIEKNFNLAFIASGDLRNVMKTLNALPENYTGHLRILINDFNPLVVSRNLAILLILGQISDEALAADVALHFWYSVFLPAEYNFMVSTAITKLILGSVHDDDYAVFPLGPKSTLLSGLISSEVGESLAHISMDDDGSVERGRAEYERIRQHPSRRDLRDRMYATLRPSHRTAFEKYRRSGNILPFGASDDHFNSLNKSLFSSTGRWLQTDFADPLEGWSINEVVEAAKAHDARPEDIYGCLYFFLSDQLRLFWKRIRSFRISFIMTNTEARHLSIAIKSGQLLPFGLSNRAGFDRIHVSNIFDLNYVGLEGVLNAWASLLSVSKHAAIVGYFMNWVGFQRGGRASDSPEQIEKLTKRMLDEGKAALPVCNEMALRAWDRRSPPSLEIMHALNRFNVSVFFMMTNIDFLYDNSSAFSTYLQSMGVEPLTRRHGLKLRKKHTIVPQRIGCTIGGVLSDLPQFDNDSWYYQSSIHCNTGFERFVEFACV